MNSTPDFDAYGIETLTALVCDSVARVADGEQLDGEDRVIIGNATHALNDQAKMFDFLENRSAASLPTMAVQGTGALVQLIWSAGEHLPGLGIDGTPESIQVVIGALAKIEAGDTETAQRFEQLFDQVAALAEEGLGEIYSGPNSRV